MSDKPQKWLRAITEDADGHNSLGLVERLRRSLRYFRTGRSKVSQQALRDFLAWQEKQTPPNQRKPIAAANDAGSAGKGVSCVFSIIGRATFGDWL